MGDFMFVCKLGLYDALNPLKYSDLIYRSSRIKHFLLRTAPVYLAIGAINMFINFFVIDQKKFLQYSLFWIWIELLSFIMTTYHHILCRNLWNSILSTENTKENKKENSRKNSTKNTTKNTTKSSGKRKTIGIWDYIAETLYGFILSSIFKLQILTGGIIISYISYLILPYYLSKFLIHSYTIITLAWLFSWTVFEYKLIYQGYSLLNRISYFEKRWLYFLAFGLPFAFFYTLCNIYFSNYIKYVAWFTLLTFGTIRIVTSKPSKLPKYNNDKETDKKNDQKTDKKNDKKNDQKNDQKSESTMRQLSIFSSARYITILIIDQIHSKIKK